MIVQDGLRRMVAEQEDVFYYLTLMNENYPHPAMPEGAEEGILRGLHPLRRSTARDVQLLGSGTILREVEAGADLLREDFGVEADVWSATELHRAAPRRDGGRALEPAAPGDERARAVRRPQCSRAATRPVVAATDYMRAFPDADPPVRATGRYIDARHRRLRPLDWRKALRAFFEVDRHHVVARRAARARATDEAAAKAIEKYEIDAGGGGAMAEVTEVTVPDIGDFDDVPVIEVLVEPGDDVAGGGPARHARVRQGDDGRAAPFAGVVQELKVVGRRQGHRGHAACSSLEAATAPSRHGTPAAAPRARSPPRRRRRHRDRGRGGVRDRGPAGRGSLAGDGDEPSYASPAVRRLAREQGIDLSTVKGTGRKGRITKEDLDAAARAERRGRAAPRAAAVDGADERVALSRIKKISGPRLQQAWQTIPHVTQHDEADITDLEAFRKQINAEQDVKVTMVALLMKACVASLKAYPEVNSSLDGDELILKRYYNLGFAADTPQGLLVPVIKRRRPQGPARDRRRADASSPARRARASSRARRCSGATFTISSLGGIGGTFFTPIINPPEVAILGVSRSAMKPVWDGSAVRAAADRAAVALLRPPRRSTARWPRASPRTWPACWPTCGGCCCERGRGPRHRRLQRRPGHRDPRQARRRGRRRGAR